MRLLSLSGQQALWPIQWSSPLSYRDRLWTYWMHDCRFLKTVLYDTVEGIKKEKNHTRGGWTTSPTGLATSTFKVLYHHQPTYLYQLLNIYSPTRQLWSSGAGLLVKPETSNKTGDRAFTVAAATTWNRLLPPKVRRATSTEQFSCALKTHLFTLD